MPILATADFPKISSELYAKTHSKVMGEGRPNGMIAHCCHTNASGISVVDIWDSKEAFEEFVTTRVAPTLEELGIESGAENVVIKELINADAFEFAGPVLAP